MAQLERTADLYRAYVKKLTSQEEELEKLRADRESANLELTKLQRAFDDFIRKLDVK